MEYVENERGTVRHAIWVYQGETENGMHQARTWCGVETVGNYGICVPVDITCKRCRLGLKKQNRID